MIDEGALLESRTLRAGLAARTDVLDKVRQLRLTPDGLHATTKDVADYFEVDPTVIYNMVSDHREELETHGYRVLTGEQLTRFKRVCGDTSSRGRSLALFTRRTVLNVAMLLRDSVVARQVRTYLLDTEDRSRSHTPDTPVDNFGRPSTDSVAHSLLGWLSEEIHRRVAEQVERLDPAAADETRVREIAEETVRGVLGTAVLPILNEAVRRDSELHRRLADHHTEIVRLNRVLWEREAAGSLAALDAMTGPQFEQHIAWLCRRDGCTGVTVTGGHGDAQADILGYTRNGRRLVVQCKRRTPAATIGSGDVQTFVGMAELEHRADVALLVSTAPFTREALLTASRHEVTAVHRGLLESWNNGARLRALS